MHSQANNVAAYMFGRTALKPRSVGAGQGASGTELDGLTVDRLDSPNGETDPPFARSAALFIFGTVTLTSGQTLAVVANVQTGDQSNASDMTDHGDALDTVTITARTALTDHPFCVKLPVDLTGAKRYVRSQQTFTLGLSGTDVASVGAVFAMGGLEHQPPAAGF